MDAERDAPPRRPLLMPVTGSGVALPAPLVPPEVELRDFLFMPLDVGRLLRSEKWIEWAEEPKIAHASMSLWCASWHEIPAGSLPNNPKVLPRLAMCTPEAWAHIQGAVLADWTLCSDGRLYHPVVAEKAIQAWERKQAQRSRTSAATEARRNRASDRDDNRNGERHGDRNVHQGTGTGTGTVERDKDQTLSVELKLDGARSEDENLTATAHRVLDQLIKITGRKFERVPSNVKPIVARLRQGYSEAELRAICAVKARQWRGTDQEKFLRPKTLFNDTNAAQYRAELPSSKVGEPLR